jgi:hypothetical protein
MPGMAASQLLPREGAQAPARAVVAVQPSSCVGFGLAVPPPHQGPALCPLAGFGCKFLNFITAADHPIPGIRKPRGHKLQRMSRYKLVFYVPLSHAVAVKREIFATGAGTIGNYKNCAFQVKGEGQFLPVENANPAIGEVGKEEIVEEYKVEVLCLNEQNTKDAVREMKKVHPYEEVAYEVYKLEDF